MSGGIIKNDEKLFTSGGSSAGSSSLGIVNVKTYGATGDGSTDDTTAVQNALNASKNVYFPVGTYIVSNITMQDGGAIKGQGKESILKFKTGSTGYMINGTGEALRIEELKLDGGNTGTYQGVSTIGTRSGVFLDTAGVSKRQLISNVFFTGFNNIALGANGDILATSEGLSVHGCNFYQNSVGIDTGPGGAGKDTRIDGTTGAEYFSITACTFNENRYGIIADSGNLTITANVIHGNGYGLYINGSANPGHSSFVGNLCNHSSVYSFYCIGNALGYQIIGNQFFTGNFRIENSKGINVQNNTIQITNIELVGGEGNTLANNWFNTDPVIDNRSLFGTIIYNNYKQASKAYVDLASPLLIDETGTTMSGTPVGSELITNGSFAVDANWTKGTGWTISAGTANGSNTSGLLYQLVGATILGAFVVVTYTISNYTAGSIFFTIGGGTSSTPRTANGTYTETVVGGTGGDTNIYFQTTGFTGSIDNVSCRVGTILPLRVATYGGKFITKSLKLSTLPTTYANNAAAITGGLVAGDIYRTGADPDVLCIVH